MRFENKVVLVTGGARGIGLACARLFAREGAKVIIADLEQDQSRETSTINYDGEFSVVFEVCDVSSVDDIETLFASVRKTYGRLDVLVANAGVLLPAPFLEASVEEFDRTIAINLRGMFLSCQQAARFMTERGIKGAIVAVSSLSAELTHPDHAAYAAAKGGVRQLVKAMALALADHRIRVNAVGPGTVDTDMISRNVMNNDSAAADIFSRTPMRRLARPEEIAAVVGFLASEEASYVTGQTLYADGGRLALNITM